MSAQTLTLLEIAKALLTGNAPEVTKAAEPDPDAIQGHDNRTEGGSPTEEQLEAARAEAQAGQQAAAAAAPAPGEGAPAGAPAAGAPEPDGDENGGKGDNDGDETVVKAEVLASIKFLADSHNIGAEEVAKAMGFSGGEGNPTEGKAPVGMGVELLQKIAENVEGQSKILDAIASFLSDLSKHTVALGTEVGKSLEASAAAKETAEKVAGDLQGIMKTAPAAPPKAETMVLKALPGDGGAPSLTTGDLFKAALSGKYSPHQIANANRAINYGQPVVLE